MAVAADGRVERHVGGARAEACELAEAVVPSVVEKDLAAVIGNVCGEDDAQAVVARGSSVGEGERVEAVGDDEGVAGRPLLNDEFGVL